MPIRSYTRDVGRRRIVVIGDGPLTAEDLIGVVNRQVSDNAWTYGLLYEATAAPEAIDPLLVYLRQAGRSLGPRGPVAIVSLGPDAANVARYMASAEGEIAVFTSRRAAETWLDDRHSAGERGAVTLTSGAPGARRRQVSHGLDPVGGTVPPLGKPALDVGPAVRR